MSESSPDADMGRPGVGRTAQPEATAPEVIMHQIHFPFIFQPYMTPLSGVRAHPIPCACLVDLLMLASICELPD